MSVSIDFSARLYAALNVAGITTLLDDYGTGHALFYANVAPSDYTGSAFINYYQIGSLNCADSAPIGRFSVNCRAATESEATTIAHAVVTAVNRVSYGDYYISCSIEQVITPADDTDIFNAPIELTIKQR